METALHLAEQVVVALLTVVRARRVAPRYSEVRVEGVVALLHKVVWVKTAE